jgi:tetratricopeptide (TPR) repeat protein
MKLVLSALVLLGYCAGVPAASIVQLWDFSDPAGSERRFRDALAGAQGDARLELETQIARTYSLRKRFADAHAALDAVEARLAGAGARPRLRYLLERGRTFNSAGDRAAARPLFVQAWELAQAAGEDYLAIDAAHMVAIVEGGEQALEWNLMALPLAANARDVEARRWRAALLNNIGHELNQLGRHGEALGYLEQALEAYKERGDKRTIRIARWMVAHTLRLLGRNDEALALQLGLKKEHDAEGGTDPHVDNEIKELLKGARK